MSIGHVSIGPSVRNITRCHTLNRPQMTVSRMYSYIFFGSSINYYPPRFFLLREAHATPSTSKTQKIIARTIRIQSVVVRPDDDEDEEPEPVSMGSGDTALSTVHSAGQHPGSQAY